MSVFSVFRDKKSNKTDETPSVESLYIGFARRTAAVRFVCIAVIAAFAVYSFMLHSEEINMDNFKYMLKFLNLGDEAETTAGSTLTYDGGGNRGLIYKGDLAVMNDSTVTIMGWDGDKLVTDSFGSDHPRMVENGVNLFCFDLGGNELRIYNSYSQVHSESFAYPIYWLAASTSGNYAVVSSSKGYRSAVSVCDSYFRVIYFREFADKYVDFLDISQDGKEFITLAHYSRDGHLISLINRFSVTSEEPVSAFEFIGEMPLGIYYTADGYAVITDSAMRFFDKADVQTGIVSFDSKKLVSCRVTSEYAIACYSTEGLSSGTRAELYNTDGSIRTSRVFSASLSDMVICGDRLFVLSPGELTSCNLADAADDKKYPIPTAFGSLLSDSGRLILFSENEARYFSEPAQ